MKNLELKIKLQIGTIAIPLENDGITLDEFLTLARQLKSFAKTQELSGQLASRPRRTRMTDGVKEKIIKDIKKGKMNVAEIARKHDVCYQSVFGIKSDMKKKRGKKMSKGLTIKKPAIPSDLQIMDSTHDFLVENAVGIKNAVSMKTIFRMVNGHRGGRNGRCNSDVDYAIRTINGCLDDIRDWD